MKHFIIAIGREFGSGGAEIGKLLAEKLGVRCYNKTIIDLAANETGFSKDFLTKEDESMTPLKKSLLSINSAGAELASDQLMRAEYDIITKLAEGDSCIIVGRCADYILNDRDDVLNVYICAPMEYRIKRIMEEEPTLTKEEVARLIRKKHSQRAGYYRLVTGDEAGDNERNHIRLNSCMLGGSENTASIIEAAVKIRFAD